MLWKICLISCYDIKKVVSDRWVQRSLALSLTATVARHSQKSIFAVELWDSRVNQFSFRHWDVSLRLCIRRRANVQNWQLNGPYCRMYCWIQCFISKDVYYSVCSAGLSNSPVKIKLHVSWLWLFMLWSFRCSLMQRNNPWIIAASSSGVHQRKMNIDKILNEG